MEIASLIDHTLLRPETTAADIERLCAEAHTHHFAAVCVLPAYIAQAARLLHQSGVLVSAVISFPLGGSTEAMKVAESVRAVEDGARELELVPNLGHLRAGDHGKFQAEIARVCRAAGDGVRVKVILETAILSESERRMGCRLVVESGAHFAKTCSGFLGGGATAADVRLFRAEVPSTFGVKASGGIRTFAQAKLLLEAGANRLGTSAGLEIVRQAQASNGDRHHPAEAE